jgi:DNA-binding winged helix-turn-helix (wHTH) protein/tetratricopeptide (TPR) repeat protein
MAQRNDRIRTLASMSRFRVGPVLVHPERLAIERDGVEISLEPRIMELLVALAEHAGEVIGAEQLLIEVWRGTFYGDNPVHRAIGVLRRQLGDDLRNPIFIETIRKRGYRLIAPVAFPEDYRRNPLQVDGWASRNPYLGLAAYDAEHAAVFFGRSRLTADVLGALRRQRETRRRFLLLVGASGCGKTSLLRASVLPLLEQAGGFDGMQALSIAHCDFAATPDGDPMLPLAAALATWQLDGRPVFAPQPIEALAERMTASPEHVSETLDDTWRKRTARNDTEHAHLLLVVDHAEALVASERIEDTQRRRVWAAIDAICAHPRGGTLMVVRGDFHAALIAALPDIAERKGSDGHIDATPPRAGEIAQIVRMPAYLSGLSFEEDPNTGARLDDVLRDAAADKPDTLPLLQHTLHTLYEQRREDGQLTFEAYRRIGGLEGAVAHRAEAVFAELPDDVRAQLDHVLAQLVVLHPDSDSVSARRAPWPGIENGAARALVDAFVKGRLFVGAQAADSPDFGVAHEALLRQWPRAHEWTQENRRLLQAHGRLVRAAARWEEATRGEDHLLHHGQPLEEALEVERRLPLRVSPAETALIAASMRLKRRRSFRNRLAIVVLIALSATSSVLALWAFNAQRQGEQRRAETQRLSDFMLVELTNKLRPLGDPSLLAEVSQRVLAVQQHGDEANLETADLLNRSRALRTLGEVLMEKARLAEAKGPFDAANRVASAALERAPSSTDAISEAGNTAYWLGYYHFSRGEHRKADEYWRRYLDHTRDLLRLEPERREWLVERSYALNNLGTLAQNQGRSDEAIAHFRASAALKRRALSQRPDDAALRYELIDTQSWISSAELTQGQLHSAAAGIAEQVAMLRDLLDSHPQALAWERRLATSLRRNAAVALYLGHTDDARRMLDECVARFDSLLPRSPDKRVWRRDLAHALLDRADLSRALSNTDAAIADLQRAETLLASLRTEEQGHAEWQRLAAIVRARLAALQSRPDDEAEALKDLSLLIESSPGDTSGYVALSQHLIVRGRRLAAAGEATPAEHDFERVRTLLSKIASTSRDPQLLSLWAQAHLLAGLDATETLIRLRRTEYRHLDFPWHLSPGAPPASHPPNDAPADTRSRSAPHH